MPFAHNLKAGIDLPVWQWLRFMPAASAAGASLCNDERGTNRYIYIILGAASFWAYDTWTDSFIQLASPPTISYAAGVTMCFDPSRGTSGYVWLFAPLTSSPWCMLAYYDVAANTWTSRAVTGISLGAAFGTESCLIHPCTTYNGAGNDDYLYLIGNNGTTWWRYSVNGNTWTASPTSIANLPAAAGAGCHICWPWGYNTDKIYYFRATGSSTIYVYTISTNTWSASLSYAPATETFTTGTCYVVIGNRVFIQKDASHRLLSFNLAGNVMSPAGMIPFSSGTAHVGDGLCYIKTSDGEEYLYYRRQTGQEFWRALLFW